MMETELCVYLQLNKKKTKTEGINVTLKTIMSTISDKIVNKITHHVPPRQIIYSKKQIGWNLEKRCRKSPEKSRNLQGQHYEDKPHQDFLFVLFIMS